MATPIEHLDLSNRAYNALLRAGIDTVEQLQQIPKEHLLSLPGIGRVAGAEILAVLEEASLLFGSK